MDSKVQRPDVDNGANVDIVVVGAGLAGLSAATAAAWSGRSVLVIEKSGTIGGTARFANGSVWIANNELSRAKGIHHDEDAEIRFILSVCWESFDADKPWCGVDQVTYERVARYVREGHKVITDLERERIQSFTQLDAIFRSYFFSPDDSIEAARKGLLGKESELHHDLERAAGASWDYRWQDPQNTVPYGKHIWANIDPLATAKYFGEGLKAHLGHILRNLASVRSVSSVLDQLPKLPGKFWGFGHGFILVDRFRRHLKRRGIDVLPGHSLTAIEADNDRVVAIDVQTPAGTQVTWRVSGGLILASGCFSHQFAEWPENADFPIRSACVAPANDGDAVRIARTLDVQIDPKPRPLLAQGVLPLAVNGGGVCHEPVFFVYGDSFFIVDRHGRRIMNEKLNYHDRAYHHVGDPEREVLFLICDRRFKERNWGFGIGIPFDQRYIIHGQNAEELKAGIEAQLRQCGLSFTLADDFVQNLVHTKDTFNDYARRGEDPDFGRGDNVYDVLGFPKAERDNDCPSRTMYPLKGDELYACIYSLSTFSTHGGVKCDADSRVLDTAGNPWKNMYAVGTCAANILNGHYPAHGMSLGTGLVFGYLAGLHITGNQQRLAK